MSHRRPWLLLLLLAAGSFLPQTGAGQEESLRVPAGFEVVQFATDELAHDICTITFDSDGQVIVSGPRYVKRLFDLDGDGRADEVQLVADRPGGAARGMLFDGKDLICTGDNVLMRLRDVDGDGDMDGPAVVLARLRNPEHGANGLCRGPDGWFYLICGNDAGVTSSHITTKGSPVRAPQSGALLRFHPETADCEILAHGFRNPYDLAFNADGHIFTVDSDGERDHHLPWYAPTRMFDIHQGEHHGWVNNGWTLSWSRPESFFDNVARVAEYGRGSPTGVEVYRHRRFPSHYRGGIFSCCWTLGRIYFTPLNQAGATYRGTPQVFLQALGDAGFAPVDLAVSPDGDLFVVIGGRGTQGGVYRIRYTKVSAEDEPTDVVASPLDVVLRADQPSAAWSRATWYPLIEEVPYADLLQAIVDPEREVDERVRAVELSVELGYVLSEELLTAIFEEDQPPIQRRVAWALAYAHSEPYVIEALNRFAASNDPGLVRAALESLEYHARQGVIKPATKVSARLRQHDRTVRAALARLMSASDLTSKDGGFDDWLLDCRIEAAQSSSLPVSYLPNLAAQIREHDSTLLRSEAVRLMQLAAGGIEVTVSDDDGLVGYSPMRQVSISADLLREVEASLSAAFPTEDDDLNNEIARLLSLLGARSNGWPTAILAECGREQLVERDLHFLMSLAHIRSSRTPPESRRTAEILLELHAKMIDAGNQPSRNWPIRVTESFARLLKLDPRLAEQMVALSQFGSVPDHSQFVLLMPSELQPHAARRLVRALEEQDAPEEWNADVIRAVAVLPPEESSPWLRSLWNEPHLQDAILAVLAGSPEPVDRSRFVEALSSLDPSSVRRAAQSLRAIQEPGSDEELMEVVKAIGVRCRLSDHKETREVLLELYRQWSPDSVTFPETSDDPLELYGAFQKFWAQLVAAHPDWKASEPQSDRFTDWQPRLDAIDWSTGDSGNGQRLFVKLQCHACHASSDRLAPDLGPVARQLSRDDLFRSIIEPNEIISPAYQTRRFVTRSGRMYQGYVIYESPDGTLLQVGPNEIVRIADDEVTESSLSVQSLMPTGLLQDCSDAELSDLYAYLRQLAAGP